MEVIESIVTDSIEVENSTSTLSTLDTEKSKSEFVWTLKATWHLVRVRLDMESEFDHPVCKKKRLWESVAEQVTVRLRAEGYSDVPAQAFECDLKWRNMLATYRKNAERAKCLGGHGVHWEFFRAMHEVLGRTYEEIESRRKAKQSDTKLEKAMDVLQLYLELQERKLNMWAQQKVLEERKIEAINNLARAINSLGRDAETTPKNTPVSEPLASLSSQN